MPAEPVYVPRMTPPGLMTADDLLHVSIPDKQFELVRGVLVVRELPGFRRGRVTMELAGRLDAHARAGDLGQVLPEVGFKVASDPDTVRGPDIAFIRRDRLPNPEPAGFPDFAPDLAVEVLSTGDRPGEILAKVADWLSAGTRLVWGWWIPCGASRASTGRTGPRPSSWPKQRSRAKTCCRGLHARSKRFSSSYGALVSNLFAIRSIARTRRVASVKT